MVYLRRRYTLPVYSIQTLLKKKDGVITARGANIMARNKECNDIPNIAKQIQRHCKNNGLMPFIVYYHHL